ncbi:hypothetical protein T484DRAFT_1758255, partial [Baffinella frigidus]
MMLSGDKSSTTQVILSNLEQKKKRAYVMLQCPHLGCEKSYRQNNQLKWHADWVHLGIRTNFVCGNLNDAGIKCAYACERPMDLVAHKKKHTSLKPHACDHVHADGKVCYYKTNHAGNLVTHKGSHMEVKRLECSDCPRTFTNTHARRCHFLRHHTNFDNPAFVAMRRKITTACNKQYATDPEFRIKVLMRCALTRFANSLGLGKNTKTGKMVGCTCKELRVHLNSNSRGLVYGMPGVVLHIDHIRPLSSFKLGCRLELLKGANWNNLQLLTAEENGRKSDRFTPADAEAYALSVGGKAIAELEKGWRLAG